MNPRSVPLTFAFALCTVITGCATVDPSLDFDRAAQRTRDVTGVDAIYRPDADDTVSARVEALLADGLTAKESVQVALLNNPQFQAAAMNVGMARADLVQSSLLSNPTLGVSLLLPSEGGLANIQANIAQNIADLWQIPIRKRGAERDLDAEIITFARRAAILTAQTKSAYYGAVGADALLAVSRENLATSRRVLDAADSRRQAGAATGLDVNLSRGPVIAGELTVERNRLAASNARRKLAKLLGLITQADDLRLIDPLPERMDALTDTDALIERAYATRLDLAIARKRAESAAAEYELQLRRVFPSVQVGLGFERDERRVSPGHKLLAETARASFANGALTGPTLSPRPNQRQTTITGPTINVELPIFDQNQARIAKAEYAWTQSLKELAAIERGLVQEVRGATDRAQTAWRIVDVYRTQSLPLADDNVAMAETSYNAGKTTLLAVLEAQRFLLQTRTDHIASRIEAAQTLPALELAINTPLGEWTTMQAATESTSANENATTNETMEQINP